MPRITEQDPSRGFPSDQLVAHNLPFPLLGLDSDNGSEFTLARAASAGVNDTLYHYCLAEQITFTRSRPYQKNDQANVEQKNWSVVRRTVGDDRLETPEDLVLLQSIYSDLRLYINFFQPVLKLISKQRIDDKVIRVYEQATTPFRRVLSLDSVPFQNKARLTALYVHLNPVILRDSIDSKVALLWNISR